FTSAGKVLLYIEKDSLSASLDYGDEIVYTGRLNELDGPQNPHEFDYRNYLNLKAVYAQAYVPASAWQLFKRREGFSLKGWSSEVRKYLLGVIGQWPLSEKEGSVTKALLLGYRYDIDDRLLRAYSSAGATHVLAVSGLHVGIVYMITYYLLFFLGKVKYGPFIRSVILVILLWAYALITGLSPSVVRAATMFSFVAVGTAFKRPTSIYNTLLASAMVLLVIKPTYLFEVGFQLSYMAVLGIVWLQPRFESLLKPQNWVLKQIWTITTVSLAAQIATFPLGLYYFHQFPALFLISNLLVIPLVTVLMYVGLVALVLSASGWMFKPLIAVYDWLLQLMNSSVEWVEGLVIFLIDQIHISRFELVLLYLFIGFGFAWLFKGGVWRLQIAKGIAVLLLVFQLIENYHLQEHPQLTVYAMRDHEAMSFMSGGKGVLVADSALLADEDAMTFHVRHHLWANNTTQVDYLRWNDDLESGFFRKKGDWLCFNNELIWYCRSDYAHGPPAATWLVGKQSGSPSPEWSPPKRIIIHKEVWPSLSREWKQWAAEKQVKVEDLGEGCFQARF
ncbi:MAG: ComEC/Rec2 family competence protein, partial [Owenweeksia sp.]